MNKKIGGTVIKISAENSTFLDTLQQITVLEKKETEEVCRRFQLKIMYKMKSKNVFISNPVRLCASLYCNVDGIE